MKILHIISSLTKGGAERVVVELANESVNHNDEVTVLCGWPEDPTLLQNQLSSDIKVLFLAKKSQLSKLAIPFWIVKNSKYLQTFDIIHSHLTYGALFASSLRAFFKIKGVKSAPAFVETYHAVGMGIPAIHSKIHYLMLSHREAVAFMAEDDYSTRFCQKHTDVLKVVIPNGISIPVCDSQEPALRERNTAIKNAEFIIGTVGRLRHDRKPWLYISLFDLIRKKLGDRVHFVMGGSGDEETKLREEVKERAMENNFHFEGLVDQPACLMKQLDVYISLSLGNATGISMMEAALCTRPVVGIQLRENYIAGNEDWVWSSHNLELVANKVVHLLLNKQEAAQLAQNQYQYTVENLSSTAMYKEYNKVYQRIVKARIES